MMISDRGLAAVVRRASGIVLGSVLGLCGLTSPAAAFRNLKEGAAAPDFTLKSLKGEDVTLSSFKGKAVLVAFVHQGQEKSEKVLEALAALDCAWSRCSHRCDRRAAGS